MSISGNAILTGIAWQGTFTVADGDTLTIPFPYVVDAVKYISDGVLTLLPESGAGSAFQVPLPAAPGGDYLPDRRADLILLNDGTGGNVTVSIIAPQTDIPRVDWANLPTEGISAHTGVTNE